jgi:uncharacterized protein YdcH (DUF465 family)
MTNDEEIKEQLLSSNSAFRSLVEEHLTYKIKLQELTARLHMSSQDQLDEVELKKKKLQLKDQMSRMIQEFRQDQVSHQHP